MLKYLATPTAFQKNVVILVNNAAERLANPITAVQRETMTFKNV